MAEESTLSCNTPAKLLGGRMGSRAREVEFFPELTKVYLLWEWREYCLEEGFHIWAVLFQPQGGKFQQDAFNKLSNNFRQRFSSLPQKSVPFTFPSLESSGSPLSHWTSSEMFEDIFSMNNIWSISVINWTEIILSWTFPQCLLPRLRRLLFWPLAFILLRSMVDRYRAGEEWV